MTTPRDEVRAVLKKHGTPSDLCYYDEIVLMHDRCSDALIYIDGLIEPDGVEVGQSYSLDLPDLVRKKLEELRS